MDEEMMVVNPVDQNFANNLAKMDDLPEGSDERKALNEENKLYHQCRKDEVTSILEQQKIDLERDRLNHEMEKEKADRKIRLIESIGKIGLGIAGLVVGCVVAFSEMDLEENGSNRSKGSQKFGQFFKPWK